MSFLKKLGQAIITIAGSLVGFGPIINRFLPAAAQPIAQAVEGELTTIAHAIASVEAVGAATGLSGAQKFQAALPLVSVAVKGSELLVGKRIKDQGLYEKAISEYTQGTVDLLNSLE